MHVCILFGFIAKIDCLCGMVIKRLKTCKCVTIFIDAVIICNLYNIEQIHVLVLKGSKTTVAI